MKRFMKLSLILGLFATLTNSLPLQAMDYDEEEIVVGDEGNDEDSGDEGSDEGEES